MSAIFKIDPEFIKKSAREFFPHLTSMCGEECCAAIIKAGLTRRATQQTTSVAFPSGPGRKD